MMFTLKFSTGNAAFQDGYGIQEAVRILTNITEAIENGSTGGKVRDINGNHIGEWDFEIEED